MHTSSSHQLAPSVPVLAYKLPVPGMFRLLRTLLTRVVRPGAFRRPACDRRDSLILDAALAIRMRHFDRAYEMLERFERVMTSDPAYLNLLGVIFEIRQDVATARRFYGLGICVDPAYQPAQSNMRRWYELTTFGHTRRKVDLGDTELRAARTLPPMRSMVRPRS